MRHLKPKYGQTLLYIALLVVVIIMMAGTRRCSSANPLSAVVNGNSSGDTLDVAIVYGPMSYYVYGDTLGGLNYDLLRKMEADLHRPVRLWPIASLDDALRRLENGTYDIFASLPLDNSIKQRFEVTRSVYLDRLVLIQRADSSGHTRINSTLDFGNDTIYIQKDSPAVTRIANLSNETGISIPVNLSSDLSEEYLCMKVATGEIPLAVVNENTARRMQKQYPLLSYDNPVSFTQFQVWMLSPDSSSILPEIDGWLDSIQKSPSYKSITEKYS